MENGEGEIVLHGDKGIGRSVKRNRKKKRRGMPFGFHGNKNTLPRDCS